MVDRLFRFAGTMKGRARLGFALTWALAAWVLAAGTLGSVDVHIHSPRALGWVETDVPPRTHGHEIARLYQRFYLGSCGFTRKVGSLGSKTRYEVLHGISGDRSVWLTVDGRTGAVSASGTCFTLGDRETLTSVPCPSFRTVEDMFDGRGYYPVHVRLQRWLDEWWRARTLSLEGE